MKPSDRAESLVRIASDILVRSGFARLIQTSPPESGRGAVDFLGWTRAGKAIGLEVKSGKAVLAPVQRLLLDEMERAGGIALLARFTFPYATIYRARGGQWAPGPAGCVAAQPAAIARAIRDAIEKRYGYGPRH